jgi:hypothetical protein
VRPHMTSLSPLETQLVLELKVGVLDVEFIEVLPGSRLRWLATPVDQYLTNPMRQASLLDTPLWMAGRAGGEAGGAPMNFLSTPTWNTS